MMMPPSKQARGVALVTGASSGIGESIALELKRIGFVTYAAARRIDQMETLKSAGIRVLYLDLADSLSIRDCISAIHRESDGIDVLVNNAGYGLYGSIEEVALEKARHQLEVNLFGLAEITKLVLPEMRSRRKGKIVNISSVGGVAASPYGAWYHASKFALEAFSSSLRQELFPFGVDVVIVRPGAIRSGWRDIAGESLIRNSGSGPYAKAVQAMYSKFMSPDFEKMVTDPKAIAKVVSEAVSDPRPKAVYTAPRLARNIIRVHKLLGSERLRDTFGRRFLGLPSKM
jgi:short-subunit dehydrogenase